MAALPENQKHVEKVQHSLLLTSPFPKEEILRRRSKNSKLISRSQTRMRVSLCKLRRDLLGLRGGLVLAPPP